MSGKYQVLICWKPISWYVLFIAGCTWFESNVRATLPPRADCRVSSIVYFPRGLNLSHRKTCPWTFLLRSFSSLQRYEFCAFIYYESKLKWIFFCLFALLEVSYSVSTVLLLQDTLLVLLAVLTICMWEWENECLYFTNFIADSSAQGIKCEMK